MKIISKRQKEAFLNQCQEFSDSEIDMGSKEMNKLVQVLSLESKDAQILLRKDSEVTDDGQKPGKETRLDYSKQSNRQSE